MPTHFKKQKAHKHALIFLTIVCFIFLSATAGITFMILKSTNKELELQVERALLSQAHNKVSELSTKYGRLTNQIRILSHSDFFRLFTYEATKKFSNYAEILELSKKKNEIDIAIFPPTQNNLHVPTEQEINNYQISTQNELDTLSDSFKNIDEDKMKLAQQLGAINKSLNTFASQSNFIGAYIYSTDFEIFASSISKISKLNERQKALMQKAAKNNAFTMSKAYYLDDFDIMIDLVQPILAPAYINEGKTEVIGFLLISLNINATVSKITTNLSPENKIKYLLIQQNGDKLINLTVNKKNQFIFSDEWKIDKNNQISFGIRSLNTSQINDSMTLNDSILSWLKTSNLPWLNKLDLSWLNEHLPFGIGSLDKSQANYSLALNVPNLPWLVVADMSITDAKTILYSSTNLILFIIGTAVIVILLLITFSWWWLVGQKERKANAEIMSLYSTIEKQKSLLENVNSNVQDGIIMRDTVGTILYANEAFAKIMQDKLENIIGSNFKNMFIGKTNMPINPYIAEVLHTKISKTYIELLQIDEEIHHFQVTYSPYINEQNKAGGLVGIYTDITNLIITQNSHQLMSQQLIKVLKRTIEAFDPYLKGHSNHVRQVATVLAYMHNLNEKQVSAINKAASLSQIGVIQLPFELRSKSTVFSATERTQLEAHIGLAKNILDDIEFGLPIQNIIYQMYEKFDGTGYPNKLKGEDICIEARILSISNTFCAMLRPRAHRKAGGFEYALEVLSPENVAYDKVIVESLRLWLKGHEGKDFIRRLGKV